VLKEAFFYVTLVDCRSIIATIHIYIALFGDSTGGRTYDLEPLDAGI
jgi:hypothetical protein